MRVVPRRPAPPAPAPYAAADTAFAEAKAYLSSREARQMSESDLERELDRRGRELMQKLLRGHLEQHSPGEATGPVAGADGVERRERRLHKRAVETIFGTVDVSRAGYASPGHDSLHPLDASLNLPPERYSLEVRRRVASAAAARSFDEALSDLSDSTGAAVPKRQAEQLAVRAAEDFDAFYEARRAAAGEPAPEESVVVLTFDGKAVVLHRRGPARRDAQGARAAPAAPGAVVSVQPPEAGREEALEADGDGGRRLRGRAVRAERGGVPAELDAPAAGGQDREDLFATARIRTIRASRRPQDVVVAGASSDRHSRRVLAAIKARRCAPPPLRGAIGLDGGSAHACPDWQLSDDAQP